jgi:hypothetical protein
LLLLLHQRPDPRLASIWEADEETKTIHLTSLYTTDPVDTKRSGDPTWQSLLRIPAVRRDFQITYLDENTVIGMFGEEEYRLVGKGTFILSGDRHSLEPTHLKVDWLPEQGEVGTG